MIKISVCIATWKRANKLREIMELLENQSIANEEYEIIVVDSNSPDNTEEVVLQFQLKYSNVTYVKDASNILASKRNVGVAKSKGDIIVFMDDDVYPSYGFIEAHLKANITPSKTFFCGQIRFPAEDVSRSNYYYFRDQQHLKDTDIGRLLPFNNIVVMNLSFRKEYYAATGGVNEAFIGYGCEDIDFGWRVIKAGFIIKYLPDALAIHREDSSTIKEYGNKLYKTGLYGNRILKEENLEVVKALTRSYSFIGYYLSFAVFRKTIEYLLLKSDSDRKKYSYYLYKAYLYSRLYQGIRDQKNYKSLDVETAKKGW